MGCFLFFNRQVVRVFVKVVLWNLGAIVVDAGTASEKGKIVGDVAEDVRERKDLTITPKKGGVGPLTYTVLFDHLIEACLKKAGML